jgi:ATP-dependent DNA ligase
VSWPEGSFADISTDTSPFENRPPGTVHHVAPTVVVEVQYTEVTEGGTLRQPSIKGLRTDVLPSEVVADDEIAGRFA